MKSYTDLEQSKKLAEMLPFESADMYYPWDIDSKSFLNVPIVKDDSYYVQGSVPCWSLAALLESIPFFITIKEEGEPDEYYHFQLNRNGSVFRSKWQTFYYGLKTERGKVHTRRMHWAVGPKEESETPLDAVFEMVCWLKENNEL